MKKLGFALIAIILCASLLVACTPGAALDRFFAFFGGNTASYGNAGFATDGNYIFVSGGNLVSGGNFVSGGNAGMVSGGNVASGGNYYVVSSGNAAIPYTPSPAPIG